MAEPMIRPYVQANAGYKAMGLGLDANAQAGVKLQKGNLSAEAGAKIGTTFGANANVDYRLPLGEKTGLVFNANGDYTKSLTTNKNEQLIFNLRSNSELPIPEANATININTNENYIISDKHKPDMYKTGAGVAFNYNPSDKLNLSLGVEGGVKGSTYHKSGTIEVGREYDLTHNNSYVGANGERVDVSINGQYSTRQPVSYEMSANKAKAYVTPTFKGEYKINPNAAIMADASLNGANVGFRWTF